MSNGSNRMRHLGSTPLQAKAILARHPAPSNSWSSAACPSNEKTMMFTSVVVPNALWQPWVLRVCSRLVICSETHDTQPHVHVHTTHHYRCPVRLPENSPLLWHSASHQAPMAPGSRASFLWFGSMCHHTELNLITNLRLTSQLPPSRLLCCPLMACWANQIGSF